MGEHFISYSCIYFVIFNALRYDLKKLGFFSQKLFFPEFRLIQSNFRSIEILFKKFSEPLPGSIDQTSFSINQTSCFKFFKKGSLIDSNLFQKFFSNFSSLYDLARLHYKFFVVFFLNFCKVFLPQGR